MDAERQQVAAAQNDFEHPYDDGYDQSLWTEDDQAMSLDDDYVEDGYEYHEMAASVEDDETEELEDGADYNRRDAVDAVAQVIPLETVSGGEELEDGASFYIQHEMPTSSAAGFGGAARACFGGLGVPERRVAYGSPGMTANVLSSKHADYREEPIEESLPIGPATRPLGARQLDIPEKVRVLRIVGRAESGDEAYAAVNANTDGGSERPIGLSWGFIQFTQRSGALGNVLKKALERERLMQSSGDQTIPATQKFGTVFGADWQALLNTTTAATEEARLAEVGGARLWEEPWLSRFKTAGAIPHFQAAQNEVAVTSYFDSILPVARWLGVHTARGLAMLVDRVVHAGVGGGLSWIMSAVGVIRTQADQALALKAALGRPGTIAEFQTQQGIEATGRWDALTHAAMMGALRALGDAAPIGVPSSDDLLKRLTEAARGTDFERRMASLYEDAANFDDTIVFG